jgi:hypothetical protein
MQLKQKRGVLVTSYNVFNLSTTFSVWQKWKRTNIFNANREQKLVLVKCPSQRVKGAF